MNRMLSRVSNAQPLANGTLPATRALKAVLVAAVVFKGLHDALLAVEDERPVLEDLLARQRLARDKDEARRRRVGRVRRGELDAVLACSRREDDGRVGRVRLAVDRDRARQGVELWVEERESVGLEN